MRRRTREGGLFVDEHGFTTTGMVIALLVSLSLVFTSAQVYRVNSAAAHVQDVADASALAAENVVAEFMLIARTCDAIVLSLSLTGLVTTGLGVAALCTPATARFSEELIDAGTKVLDARNAFSSRVKAVLSRLQEALPFMAAANAAGVAMANDTTLEGSNYVTAAVLVPWEGTDIEIDDDDKSREAVEKVREEADEVRQQAEQAEQAAKEAQAAKEIAYQHDCGLAPGYCMYERASSLAGLSGSLNPHYASVDAWSFSVALERARAYYAARLAQEAPLGTSVEEQADSVLRARFFRYQIDQLSYAYVIETPDSFDYYLPRLPKSLPEVRETTLYTQQCYPITESDDGQTMHAWEGCPLAAGWTRMSSVFELEQGEFETCPACQFVPSSLGNVAAASTSIDNGFEHHYKVVVDQAAAYKQAIDRAAPAKEQVKSRVSNLLERLKEAAEDTAGKRIELEPPGRYGVIALTANVGSIDPAGRLASSFAVSSGQLGPTVAVSAATLLDEGDEAGATVLSSLLDGLKEDGGVAVGALGVVLDCWSALLGAYANGQAALIEAIEGGLNAVPVVGPSGLGTWAASKLRDVIEAIGLQPAKIGALKPVLVNSTHVAQRAEGGFASGYLQVKSQIVAHPSNSGDVFSWVVDAGEAEAHSLLASWDGQIEIIEIELLGSGGPTIPLSIPLPDAVRQLGFDVIETAFARLRGVHATDSGLVEWR